MPGHFVEAEGESLIPQIDLIAAVLFQAAQIHMGNHGLLLQAAGQIAYILAEGVQMVVLQRSFRQIEIETGKQTQDRDCDGGAQKSKAAVHRPEQILFADKMPFFYVPHVPSSR